MEDVSHDHVSSGKWWLDSHTSPPHQSQWLRATLSDLDEKIIKMVNIMEEDGESFAKRAEMFYNSRPEFINMLKDLHKSYCSIAEKYDQLISSPCKNLQIRRTRSLELLNLEPLKIDSGNMILKKKEDSGVENWGKVSNKWDEMSMQMWELIDENKKQQAELIRRNEENRKEIKSLYETVEKLMEENKLLKEKLAQRRADINQNQSHLSRLRSMFFGKVLN